MVTTSRRTLNASSVTNQRSDGPGSCALTDRTAWRDAVIVWLAQHAALAVVVYIGRTALLTQLATPPNGGSVSWGAVFQHWDGWDGSLYAAIARQGYHSLWMAAFPPLLPTVESSLSALFHVKPALAGLLVASLAELGAFGLLRILAEREADRSTARRALLYLAIFPTAFYLALPYTESLFLVFSISVFLAVRSQRWAVAGGLVSMAVLTRQTGVLLCIPMLVEYWRAWRSGPRQSKPPALGQIIVGLALPLLTTLAWYVFLFTRYGTFSAVSQAEEQAWGRGFAVPVVGVARAGHALLTRGANPNFFQMHVLLDGAFTLAFVLLVVAMWRTLPARYSLYCAALLLVVLTWPAHNWLALSSNMRYMLGAFPIFLALARWGKRSAVDRILWGISLPLLTLFTLLFFMASWVA